MAVRLSIFLGRHGHQLDPVGALDVNLLGGIQAPRVLASAQGKRDRRDDRDEQHDRGDLECVGILRVQHTAQLAGIAVAGGELPRARCDAVVPAPQHGRHLRDHDDAHDEREGKVAPEPLTQPFQVDVQHHDDEKEQHHYRANVDHHQHDREELGAQEQPDRCRREEREDQEQCSVHRVARRDHAQRGEQHDRRESVEKRGFQVHRCRSALLAGGSARSAIGRIRGTVLGDLLLVALPDGEQHLLGVVKVAARLAVVLQDSRLDDRVHRAGFLAEPAINASEHADGRNMQMWEIYKEYQKIKEVEKQIEILYEQLGMKLERYFEIKDNV